MRICVVGWYFYPEFYNILLEIHHKYPVTVVSHKKGMVTGLPTVEIPNVGLEWGAYSYYLQNIWKGDSILFTHDDNKVFDNKVFDEIADITKDCSMIFRTLREGKCNLWFHGRAFLCSERFLKFFKNYKCKCSFSKNVEHKGFWYDPENFGFTVDSGNGQDNVDINRGTHHMKMVTEKLSKETGFDFSPTIIRDYLVGFRGKIGIEGLALEISNEKYRLPLSYYQSL